MKGLGIIGLGLVATGKRSILPGYEFDSLYDRSGLLGTNPIIGDDQSDTYDTLNRMVEIVLDTLADTENVAAKLKGRTLEETLRNDWNHVYRHFQYEKDANGIEQIRRPARSWSDRKRGIDCDCMSVVLSSLLYHQRIPHAFRKATYTEETGWQHVYVIVPKKGVSLNDFTGAKKVSRNKYFTLDCVVDKFDYEVQPLKKFDKVMKIQYLNGIDSATINGGITPEAASLLSCPPPRSVEELLGLFGNEFSSLDGLGEVNDRLVKNAFLTDLKQHLVNTRSILTLNPALTVGLYSPSLFAQRLDALINAFDNPTLRTNVLGELASLEEREEINGLGNVGLGKGFFKKIGQGIKNVAQKVGKGVASAAKSVAKAVVRFNPATIAIRNGLLLAMKLNIFRIAEKLGYGLWTEEQAKAKGLNLDQLRKNKKVLDKVRGIHKAIGGNVSKLDNAIREGWRKGVKKHHLISGLGTTSLYTKSRLSAAAPLLQLVNEHLKDVPFSSLLRKTESSQLSDFFQALRTNQNGMATKLSLAYKSSSEAGSYDKSEYKKLLDRVRAIERLVTVRGGTPQQLHSAVEAGKLVAITTSPSNQGIGILPAAIAPAAATLAKISSLLKSVDFKSLLKNTIKNKAAEFVKGKASATNANVDQPSATSSNDDNAADLLTNLVQKNPKVANAVNRVKKAAKKFKSGASRPSQPASRSSASPSSASTSSSGRNSSSAESNDVQDTTAEVVETKVNSPVSDTSTNADSSDGSSKDQGSQLVSTSANSAGKKDNTLTYVAIGAGVLTGLLLLTRSSRKPVTKSTENPSVEMNGVSKKQKTKSSQRTRLPSARTGKKVMAITM
jgi:hypothetical protein